MKDLELLRVETLLEENNSLIYYIVNKYYPQFSGDDEIYQIGLIALWKAILTFAEDKGIKFSTYAGTCIKNNIFMELRSRMRRAERYPTVSLDEPITETELTLADVISNTDLNSTLEISDLLERISLSPSERIILSLKMNGMKQNEIAGEVLGTKSNISRKVNIIRAKIREALDDI